MAINRKQIEVGEEVEVCVGGLWQPGVVVGRETSRFGKQYDKLQVQLGDTRAPTVMRGKKSVRRPHREG